MNRGLGAGSDKKFRASSGANGVDPGLLPPERREMCGRGSSSRQCRLSDSDLMAAGPVGHGTFFCLTPFASSTFLQSRPDRPAPITVPFRPCIQRIALPIGHHPARAFDHRDRRGVIIQASARPRSPRRHCPLGTRAVIVSSRRPVRMIHSFFGHLLGDRPLRKVGFFVGEQGAGLVVATPRRPVPLSGFRSRRLAVEQRRLARCGPTPALARHPADRLMPSTGQPSCSSAISVPKIGRRR